MQANGKRWYIIAEHRTTSRILDILEIVYQYPEGLTFTEICNKLDMPKSSVHPLLVTLNDRNYVHCAKKNNKYYIGHQVFLLGHGSQGNLMDKIQHEMDELSKNIGETTFLGILSGGIVVYLLKAEFVSSVIKSVMNLGQKLPAYATAFGKALLSQYTESELEELYSDGMIALTENTVNTINNLYEQCKEIRQTGFAYEKEESTYEIQCLGVALSYKDEYLAGISVVVPVYRYSKEKEREIKSELVKAKLNIEALIEKDPLGWVYSGS